MQVSGLPGNDRPLTQHRDPAPGKVIRSCPVASFDPLTKIDPADTMAAALASHCLDQGAMLAGANPSAGAALQIVGREHDRRQVRGVVDDARKALKIAQQQRTKGLRLTASHEPRAVPSSATSQFKSERIPS